MHFESPENQAGKIVFFIFLILMIAVGILSNHFKKAFAQESNPVVLEEQIATSILNEMIMCRRKDNGEIVYHPHCRDDKTSCVAHAKSYAKTIIRYSEEFRVDPWLSTAVAGHESNFDAYRVGSKGERGIFQLLPYSPWGMKSLFTRNKGYRELCKMQEGHCQEDVAALAIQLIRNSITHCGSVPKALTMYNTGECSPLNKKYTSAVFAKLKALKSNADSIKWCTGEKI